MKRLPTIRRIDEMVKGAEKKYDIGRVIAMIQRARVPDAATRNLPAIGTAQRLRMHDQFRDRVHKMHFVSEIREPKRIRARSATHIQNDRGRPVEPAANDLLGTCEFKLGWSRLKSRSLGSPLVIG
jgi:hypothetical protein